MEQQVLIEDTFIDPLATATTNQALVKETKDNMDDLSHTIQTQNVEIKRLKLELEQSRTQITIPIANTLSFDNFLVFA